MRIIELEEIDSTNNYLKNMKDIRDFDIVSANIQTNGRGRRGNNWVSQDGMALFSFAVKDNHILEENFLKIPLVAGITTLRGLSRIENLDYKFKWTNDVYLDNKKLAGILVEKIKDYFIIGIGININNIDFGDIDDIAISLRKKTDKFYIIRDVIICIVNEFKKAIENDSWENLRDEINSCNFLYNKKIDVMKYGENIGSGKALNISEDGSLEVEIDGEIKTFYIGEIHIGK